MRVPYGEELAIHTGPESCADSRKVTCEALTGGVWAGLLSRERYCKLQGADAVHKVEGNTGCIDRNLRFTALWHHVYDVGRLR